MYLHIYIYIYKYSSIYTETISVVFKIPIYPATHSTEETPPSFTKLATTDPTDFNDRIEAIRHCWGPFPVDSDRLVFNGFKPPTYI